MIAGDRRLAIVGGLVVSAGDQVGVADRRPYRTGRRGPPGALWPGDPRGDQAAKAPSLGP